MKCSRVRDKLIDYASAELTPSEMDEMRGHLAACEQCRAELAIAQDASSALSFLDAEECTPDLVSAVRRRLDQEQRRSRPVLAPRLALASATVLVCIVVVTGWLMWRPGGHQNTNMAHRPGKTQPPVVAHRVVQPEVAVPAVRVSQPVSRRIPPRTVAVSHPRPHIRYAVAAVPKPDRRVRKTIPAPAPVTHRPQPEIRMAVRPRAPESYIVQVGDEEQATPAELTVVRHFDVGGNVRSVTITNKPQPSENRDPGSLIPGNTRLLEAGPHGLQESATTHIGGSITNA